MTEYEILTGVGNLYVAPVGTTFPTLTATPSASWTYVGETQDGVTVTADQSIEEITVDQETGPVEAVRAEESLMVETKMARHTIENLAIALGQTAIDTPPSTGVAGTREVPLYKGSAVQKYALLFRGKSPYGDYPAQFEIKRGYFGGSTELEFVKDANTPIPVEFHALVDLNAATNAEKFGRVVAQDAPAT
jgi:hypothetical protein